jgi:hypothetical protein
MYIFSSMAKSCGQFIPTAIMDIANKLLIDANNKNFS